MELRLRVAFLFTALSHSLIPWVATTEANPYPFFYTPEGKSDDGGMHEKRIAESLRKRAEVSAATADGERTTAMDTEPPARGVRKRHHTLTNAGGDLATMMKKTDRCAYSSL